MTALRFTVPGEPIAKGRARARAVKTPTRTFVQHYTPKATRAYEEQVALIARNAAAAMHWRFGKDARFGIALRVCRTHEGSGGDADNYLKAIADGLNRAGNVWPDDRRVRHIRFALEHDAERPRVDVAVWVLAS